MAYDDPKFEKLLADERALRKKYGSDVVKTLARRYTSLKNTANLAELLQLPGRTHQLRGDRAGSFAMDLPNGRRLIFRPTPPVPTHDDGGIDLKYVTQVTLIEISEHYA